MEAVISARGARGEAIGGARRRSQRQLIAAEWREIAATGNPPPQPEITTETEKMEAGKQNTKYFTPVCIRLLKKTKTKRNYGFTNYKITSLFHSATSENSESCCSY